MNLSFPADRLEMSFSAGCNSFFGDYTVNNDVFEISGMGGTEMGCETDLMEQDNWLVDFSPLVQRSAMMENSSPLQEQMQH